LFKKDLNNVLKDGAIRQNVDGFGAIINPTVAGRADYEVTKVQYNIAYRQITLIIGIIRPVFVFFFGSTD
jgi:hypothetical protein